MVTHGCDGLGCEFRAAKVAERNVKMRQRAATGGVMQPGGIASYQPQHQQFQQHQQRAYSADCSLSQTAMIPIALLCFRLNPLAHVASFCG